MVPLYRWTAAGIERVEQTWNRPRIDPAGWEERIRMVTGALTHGGAALGSFNGDWLVGFAAIRQPLEVGVDQLAALWVSRDHRRHGTAGRLVQQCRDLARSGRTLRLYVSAAPTESSYRFYLSQGFRPTPFVHRELFVLEPEDIHMVMELGNER